MLFTAPGERVNRPDFGSGLLQLVFAPNSDELAAATQFLVQGALQQWLGDLIEVERRHGREPTTSALRRDGSVHRAPDAGAADRRSSRAREWR